jgi:hypothetical protein
VPTVQPQTASPFNEGHGHTNPACHPRPIPDGKCQGNYVRHDGQITVTILTPARIGPDLVGASGFEQLSPRL